MTAETELYAPPVSFGFDGSAYLCGPCPDDVRDSMREAAQIILSRPVLLEETTPHGPIYIATVDHRDAYRRRADEAAARGVDLSDITLSPVEV